MLKSKCASTEWIRNPEIFAVNREKAHSTHEYYVTKEGKEKRTGCDLRQYLNGTWDFFYAEKPEDRPAEFYKEEFDDSAFDKIQVPGHIQLQGYDNCHYTNTPYPWDGWEKLAPPQVAEIYNPVGSYVKRFTVDKALTGKKLYISFQGVESAFYVWLNGEFVGYSEDSFTPSEFDLTDKIREGENRLAVEVYKRCTGTWLEDQDFWRFSGIFRDVYLYAVPEVHVRDLRVIADTDDSYKAGKLQASWELQAEGTARETAKTSVKLLDADGNCFAASGKIAGITEFSATIEDAKLWSEEVPNLYTLEMEIYNGEDQLVETVYETVGFRRFEMKDGVMYINGKRIIFRGVNRHEFNYERGRSITEEDMMFDILFMKRNNINAVRTCHYPNQKLWMKLCDQYGIYLIDETNMETHGSWLRDNVENREWNLPGSFPEWTGAVIDRATSMYERDKNHPSVLIWSLGNESHGGDNLAAMSKYFHDQDSTRLVHYESIFWDRRYDYVSDMESRMYAKPAEIVEYLEKRTAKPYLSCEYMHAMGNSCGGLHLYTELEDRYEQYQGGFIWDYIDQAILVKEENGEEHLAYGGDFGDRPSDYEFCGNGIIFADRTPTPKMQEVKLLYAPVVLTPDQKGVTIRNRNNFVTTEGYQFRASLLKNGVEIGVNDFQAAVEPLSEKYISLEKLVSEVDAADSASGNMEYTLQVTVHLAEDTMWAHAGHEISWGQYTWKEEAQEKKENIVENAEDPCFRIVHGDTNVGIHGKDFRIMFSDAKGTLTSLCYNGTEYVNSLPKTTYWRACTDNDRGCGHGFDRGIWMAAGMYQKKKEMKTEITENQATITFTYEIPNANGAECEIRYQAGRDGVLHVHAAYKGVPGLAELPAFGMEWKFSKEYDQFRYYGMGPEENYCDRKHGVRLGIYENTAADNMTPYLVPQECGNRTGTRWVELCNAEGKGLHFETDAQPFEFSILPYSANQIEEALHQYELTGSRFTWLRIMACQMGIGGDDSWGAPVQQQYHISSDQTIEYAYSIRPIK